MALRTRTRIIHLGLIATLALASAAEAAITDRIKRSFNVADGGTLTVKTNVGDVEVVAGSNRGVSVEIIRTAKTTNEKEAREIFAEAPIEFSQSGNDVRISARRVNESGSFFSFWSNNRMKARFIVSVPSRYNVNLSTSGGDIKVSDINGEAELRTSGGDIDLGKISGKIVASTSGGDVTVAGGGREASLRTSGGDIAIDQVGHNLDARTSGGDIRIGAVRGGVVAKTSGGDISIREVLGVVEANSSGGDVSATIGSQPGGPSRLSTSGGRVVVTLAPAVSVEIDAETSGGTVNSEIPVTTSGKIGKSSLHGTVNGGGPRLVLRSSGGNIRVRKM
ncbi:MAG TPA: DUF4097 family beta strand repeat-containing protein [Thermoanaerobaculia bacterium]|nr:DUF4097 family beta strand repeat-containing protein [Thermoanaerobaculia bacterium]